MDVCVCRLCEMERERDRVVVCVCYVKEKKEGHSAWVCV